MNRDTAPTPSRNSPDVPVEPITRFPFTNVAKLAYTIPQAVDVSGISRRTLYRYISNKSLPIVKVGQRTLIRTADLVSFIDQRLVA